MRYSSRLRTGLLIVLLFGAMASGTYLSTYVGYAIVSIVYATVLVVCYARGMFAIQFDPWIATPIVFLWILFVTELILHPTQQAAVRTAAFIGFTGVNLFVVPATFSREEFVDALAIVAAVVSVLAIPIGLVALSTFVPGERVFGVWGITPSLFGIDVSVPVFTSIFRNPNYLSSVTGLGVVASIGVARTRRRRWAALALALVCLVGVGVSRSRAVMAALLGAGVLYLTYRVVGIRGVAVLTILGSAGGALAFAVVIGVVNVDIAASVFNYRRGIWTAALRAISERPLLGWGLIDETPILVAHGAPVPASSNGGFGTHNSYLRVFLLTGIVGGIVYLSLCAGAVVRALAALRDHVSGDSDDAMLPLLSFFLAIQLFQGGTIFGLSVISALGALLIGFNQHPERVVSLSAVVRSWTDGEHAGDV